MKSGSFWLMFTPSAGRWFYAKAEPPCNKGEMSFSLRWFNVVIGWQQRPEDIHDAQ